MVALLNNCQSFWDFRLVLAEPLWLYMMAVVIIDYLVLILIYEKYRKGIG